MDYILAGFKQDKDVRVFAFQSFGNGGTIGRTQYSVRADLTATRKHGIALQDLPVLCRNLLTRHQPAADSCLTFSDDELLAIQEERILSRAAAFRKPFARATESDKQWVSPWKPPVEPSTI